ncbi:glycoside hydrolase family 13 protein [Bifidobacterium psychraerophilum]
MQDTSSQHVPPPARESLIMTTEGDDTTPWWKGAVVYQIYPRSFKDTTGDGIGDINGITEEIPYLHDLGIDAIWISPFYPSPQEDGGYDVADYRNVDPLLGTLTDFDNLIQVAHHHSIRIVVDLVPNHTSSAHPWFIDALNARPGSAERDRYIFRDGRGPNGNQPPTDWICGFGGPAWERVPDGQWYLHMWSVGQPDLNWKNEEVREDFLHTIRFWSDKGVDGFRVDAAQSLVKDMDRDDLNSWSMQYDVLPQDGSHPLYDRNELHDIYRSWRKVFNEYNPHRFAIAEAWVNPKRQYLYASADELGQVFNFEFAKANWTAGEMRRSIEKGLESANRSHSTTTWVMSNHDVPRHATRYALPQVAGHSYHQLAQDWILRDGKTYIEDRELGTRRSRAAILLELALPGSAYVYQGEELGLFEVPDIPWNALEDPTAAHSDDCGKESIRKGRDGCRVPIPWSRNANDGFGFSPSGSEAKPHLPQPQWFKDFSVEAEANSNDSMLNLYKAALHLRAGLQSNDFAFSWRRDYNDEHVLAFDRASGWSCITNFGGSAIQLPQGAKVLLTSTPLTTNGMLPTDASVWIS